VSDPLIPPLGPDDHVDGPSDGPLELVMFGDFQCPFCAAAQPILRRVRDRLGLQLRFAFRQFPLRTLHPDAERAAQASEAAAAQGAFWQMHDALYELRGRLGTDDIVVAATRIGLDALRIRDELESGAHAAAVQADVESGEASGVTGTPTFFTGGRRHRGGFDAQSLMAALEGR
jgi:protein-disulfide isomerase